ncbi:hypothetical protein CEXT_345801 [Caerostris extrusa]|uniref:Ycf1 n=1 Tax=Caerostris extrusa TaxID=172846 RepID=A0AAV4VSH0_CAEEX|nr:hypothetical protein CEXT_345801 [Caerostris extrusa]
MHFILKSHPLCLDSNITDRRQKPLVDSSNSNTEERELGVEWDAIWKQTNSTRKGFKPPRHFLQHTPLNGKVREDNVTFVFGKNFALANQRKDKLPSTESQRFSTHH